MKKFYKENRVYVILMGVVLVCFIIIGIFLLKYFYYGSGATKYGNRLDGGETIEIKSKKEKSISTAIKENEKVSNAVVRAAGKIVYISIYVSSDTTLQDAENIAVKALDYFSDEEKAFYELQFFLKNENKDNGFTISGSKSIGDASITWNNNTPVEKEEEENEK